MNLFKTTPARKNVKDYGNLEITSLEDDFDDFTMRRAPTTQNKAVKVTVGATTNSEQESQTSPTKGASKLNLNQDKISQTGNKDNFVTGSDRSNKTTPRGDSTARSQRDIFTTQQKDVLKTESYDIFKKESLTAQLDDKTGSHSLHMRNDMFSKPKVTPSPKKLKPNQKGFSHAEQDMYIDDLEDF